MIKLLFVCLGNICRSPFAEGFMTKILLENKLSSKIKCDSAGTSCYHIGESPDQRIIDKALIRNVKLTSYARQIKTKDLINFNYLIAMDKSNLSYIQKLDTNKMYSYKVNLFSKFSSFDIIDVPDPYYKTNKEFDFVLDILEDACNNFLNFLLKKYYLKKNNML